MTLWDNDPARLKAATAELGDKSRAERVDVVDPADVERATEASRRGDGPDRRPRLLGRSGGAERAR